MPAGILESEGRRPTVAAATIVPAVILPLTSTALGELTESSDFTMLPARTIDAGRTH